MKTDLYCIDCSKMVVAETDFAGRLFHYNTIQVNNSPDPGTRYDLRVCNFPEGSAYCPPPAFDLDEYIRSNGIPPEILPSKLAGFEYDVVSDSFVGIA